MSTVTAIVNVHREGLLAQTSLQSAADAREAAAAVGLDVEIIAVADCADDATRAVVAAADRIRLVETEVDDLGLARNVGVASSSGDFIAFLDGDDLWSRNWLVNAHAAATCDARPTIWHPEASLLFGPSQAASWLLHPSIETDQGDWITLGIHNHWTSLSFSHRKTYLQIPFQRTDLSTGFGYEDWSWNMDAVASGFLHQPVPGTVHMVRVRDSSLLRRTLANKSLVTPSSLYPDRIGWLARHRALSQNQTEQPNA